MFQLHDSLIISVFLDIQKYVSMILKIYQYFKYINKIKIVATKLLKLATTKLEHHLLFKYCIQVFACHKITIYKKIQRWTLSVVFPAFKKNIVA